MKPIELDFATPRKRLVSWIGFLLLMAGLLLSTYLVYAYSQSSSQKEKLKSELARVHARQQGDDSDRSSKELEPALQSASAVIERLAFPWDKLFKTLESTIAGRDVALLSIQPDRDGGVVILKAEARDWNAMLGYMKRLGEEKLFTDVHLVSHQLQQTSQQHSITFVLSCAWGNPQAQ